MNFRPPFHHLSVNQEPSGHQPLERDQRTTTNQHSPQHDNTLTQSSTSRKSLIFFGVLDQNFWQLDPDFLHFLGGFLAKDGVLLCFFRWWNWRQVNSPNRDHQNNRQKKTVVDKCHPPVLAGIVKQCFPLSFESSHVPDFALLSFTTHHHTRPIRQTKKPKLYSERTKYHTNHRKQKVLRCARQIENNHSL